MISIFSDNLNLSDSFDRFFEDIEANCSLSKSSIEKYKEIRTRIIKFFGNISIKKIDTRMITKYKQYLNQPSQKKDNLSPSYKNQHLTLLRLLLKFVKEKEGAKVMDYAQISKFRVPIREVETLNESELSTVLDYPNEKTITGCRLKAYFEVSFSTGCRVKEVLGLKISDINFKDRIAHIRTKNNKPHTILFSDSSIEAINRYLAMRKDSHSNLFVTATPNPKPWQTNDVERSLRMIGRKLKLSKNLRPHILRKSAATHMYKNNVSLGVVQNFLNHSSARTTLTYYLGNSNFEELRRNHDRVMNNLDFKDKTDSSGEGVRTT